MTAITRGALKGKILRLLMKTATQKGFYTDDRINDSIDEAMDFVATEFFIAGQGWSTKIMYFDTEDGQVSIDIPVSHAMIREMRYLIGTVYQPMGYDAADGAQQFSSDSGTRQFAFTYRIVDNAYYFNPPLAEGGTKFLQVEYNDYPKRMLDDTDFMESQFDNAMQHFIKYRSASILAAALERTIIPWADLESSWYRKMQAIIARRNMQSKPIREFQGW